MTSVYPCPSLPQRNLVRRSPPPPAVVRPPASYRYDGIARAARINWIAVLVSATLHAGLLQGFNHRPAPPRHVAVAEDPPALLMLPDLKEPEEEKPRELNDEEAPPGLQVPTLQDVPMVVPIDASFTQLADLALPTKLEGAAGIIAIPLNIQHGRANGGGLGNIFNIDDLDHKPEPIVQTPPAFPYDLKRSVSAGQVVVEFVITATGDTTSFVVVSSTHTGFEHATLEAISKWHFKPGMKAGHKVNTRVRQAITFSVLD